MITRPATWAKLQDEIPTITELAPTEQTALHEAYSALETAFGDQFFVETHPILGWVWDASPISRRQFLRLYEMLGRTTTGGADRIRRKLTQVKEAQKTLDVLGWWADLLREGCAVDFEPDLPGRHGQADLLVRMPQSCYIELTELETSKPRANLQATRNLLQHLIHGYAPPLCFAGRFANAIPPTQWPGACGRLIGVAANCDARRLGHDRAPANDSSKEFTNRRER